MNKFCDICYQDLISSDRPFFCNNCGQDFHRSCIDTATMENNRCPACKSPFFERRSGYRGRAIVTGSGSRNASNQRITRASTSARQTNFGTPQHLRERTSVPDDTRPNQPTIQNNQIEENKRDQAIGVLALVLAVIVGLFYPVLIVILVFLFVFLSIIMASVKVWRQGSPENRSASGRRR